jgi:hypothetical protein
MKKTDEIDKWIIGGLRELLGGKSKKTPEERAELRDNIKLAMGYKKIAGDEGWGSGFSNGEDKEAQEDAGLDDE